MSHPNHTTDVERGQFPEIEGNRRELFWIRRDCRKRGGHWWHPSDPMIENRCCQCGAVRDGMPKDGT